MVPRVPSYSHLRPHLPHQSLSTISKLSNRSHSSSLADDERSSSAETDSMGPGQPPDYRTAPPQYAGEDTQMTSKRELYGWYACGFASEVFIICGIGSFIPITLEQLARENGVLLSDGVTSCGSSSTRPYDHGAISLLPKNQPQCVVYVLGVEINTASFAMYTFSLSVLFQALLVVSVSCAADHGNYRKRLLLVFAFSGSMATMLFLPVGPKIYLLGALLAIVANTCFGATSVLVNSFLPVIVRHHPKTQIINPVFSPEIPIATHEEQALDDSFEPRYLNEATSLLCSSLDASSPRSDVTSVELHLSTQISSTGIGIGYSAGLLLQCISIFILLWMKSTTFSLRVVLGVIGLWWFLFTIPPALWLRSRPGPPLSTSSTSRPSYILRAWTSLFRTVSLARQLKDTTLFLLAWFVLSDAIATVSGTAVLYAKTQLYMAHSALGLINVIATTAGVLGAFTWPFISRFLSLKPHQTILACIMLFELVPLYGLLSYIPVVQRLGMLGLQQPWEMYPLGFLYGFVLGGLSSYCRALYSALIPPGSEAAFYALYAITDKGSSIFGPAIVGAITDATGEVRPAFLFLAVMVAVPAPLIWGVDAERGRRDGIALSEVLGEFENDEARRVGMQENDARVGGRGAEAP